MELSGDGMKYVVLEDTLLEALRIKWQNAKMTKLDYSNTCISFHLVNVASLNNDIIASKKEEHQHWFLIL